MVYFSVAMVYFSVAMVYFSVAMVYFSVAIVYFSGAKQLSKMTYILGPSCGLTYLGH
jgi:hypothetical protein